VAGPIARGVSSCVGDEAEVARLAFVVVCRFSVGLCSGVLFLAWLWRWRAVSRLTCVVASHAVLTVQAFPGSPLEAAASEEAMN
jgi:hypothetical protein